MDNESSQLTESRPFPLASPQVDQVFSALSAAQGEFGPITKDRTVTVKKKDGGSYTYQYADLATIIGACRYSLAAYGLCVTQLFDPPVLLTVLGHTSGQYITSRSHLAHATDPDPKAVGSDITYMRRYAYCALLGVSTEEDDDGDLATEASHGATRGTTTHVARPQPAAPSPPPPPATKRSATWIRFSAKLDTLLQDLRVAMGGDHQATDRAYRQILGQHGATTRAEIGNDDTEAMSAIVIALKAAAEQAKPPQAAQDAPTIADRIDGGAEIGPPTEPQAAAESAPDDEAAEVAAFIQRLAPDDLLDLIKSLEDELAITNKARAGARTEHLGTVILSEARPEPLRQYGIWLQTQRNTQLGMPV